MIFLYPFLYVSAFSPRWNETFTFLIQVPELALIRFVVETQGFLSGNELLGQYTLPVLCMNKGNVRKCKMIFNNMYQSHTWIIPNSSVISSTPAGYEALGGPMDFLLLDSRDRFFLWKVIWG